MLESIEGNEIGNQSSNGAVCISLHSNSLWKGMNPSVFLQAMCKQ